jgi:hypothetical protein
MLIRDILLVTTTGSKHEKKNIYKKSERDKWIVEHTERVLNRKLKLNQIK